VAGADGRIRIMLPALAPQNQLDILVGGVPVGLSVMDVNQDQWPDVV
jgi:hypothetical protein